MPWSTSGWNGWAFPSQGRPTWWSGSPGDPGWLLGYGWVSPCVARSSPGRPGSVTRKIHLNDASVTTSVSSGPLELEVEFQHEEVVEMAAEVSTRVGGYS